MNLRRRHYSSINRKERSRKRGVGGKEWGRVGREAEKMRPRW